MNANRKSSLGAGRFVQPPLSVQYTAIERLKPDQKNARLHSPRQLRRLAESIAAFGFNVPILVDADLQIIAGHGRVLAAKRLGLPEVPIIQIEHLSDVQRRAFMIADNRLTEIAAWDDRLLGEQLKELASVELDFDLEATGFEIGEIDLRIEALSSPEQTKGESEPELPAPKGEAITCPGDLWLLGPHRLLCGDGRSAPNHRVLMEGRKAAAVFTDPPFNVPIDGHVSGLGRLRHREFAMAAGEMTPESFTQFLTMSLQHMASVSRAGALLYVCMDWRHIEELLAAARATAVEMLNLCVWTKPNAGMGSFYRSQHELVFVFANPGGRRRNNVQLGTFGRNRTNVWSYAAGPGFGRAGEEGRLAALHPTVKPVAMIADAILDCTANGDIILDPFLGSGSTLMAAERTRRRCFGIEIDPLYCDVVIRRWQSCSGGVATLATTGESFAAVSSARGQGGLAREAAA